MKYDVILFWNARNEKPADINRQMCQVYGENAMSDGMVMKWVIKFKGRNNVLDEPRSGRPSVVNDVFRGGLVLRQGDAKTCDLL